MNINLVVIGRIKEKYITDGILEFTKRLKPFCRLKVLELKEEGNDFNRELSIVRESNLIMDNLERNKGYNILLDIKGKMLSSEEMASTIEEILLRGNSTINFIIGGSYGVSEELKNKVDFRLSFSKMTFPHQLMRLIMIEQIYRWFSILKNTKYHK